ncbi:hypothetical protein SmJEL517_g02717 [Synchytrium microbalum]|uniref:C2H2-type domain-containing protein n=1 Tax=Synchytrium microbalum TaxID=1806994 RepID=A0A507BZN3_9FUNG|nr:uncharacterized protein SmJEL517_g02717 [Synchytrium microbalum]TPX34740.1 hypothetical protein SmJEL517_g02717 [Synchytrium microbalum]
MPAELLQVSQPMDVGRYGSFKQRYAFGTSANNTAGKSMSDYFMMSQFSTTPSMAMNVSPSPRFTVLEDKFCKNFTCCGLELDDLHMLLQHFEEIHGREDENMSDDEDAGDDDMPFELEGDAMDVDMPTRPQTITTVVTSPQDKRASPPPGNNAEFTTTLSNLTEVILKAHIQNQQQQAQDQPDPATMQIVAPSDIYTPDTSRSASPASSRRSDSNQRSNSTPSPRSSAQRNKNHSSSSSNARPEKRHSTPSYDYDMDAEDPDSDTVSIGGVEANINLPVINIVEAPVERISERPSRRVSPVLDEDSMQADRPYKCKISGCTKAYKNPGGLKYHMQHGHCEDTGDPELNNVIHKPYQCTVPECGKRYKNLNGLKYHIEHAHVELLG